MPAAAGAAGRIALRHGNLAVARWTPPGEDVAAPIDSVTLLFDTSASRAIGFDTRIHRLGDLVRALLVRQGRDFGLRVIVFDQAIAQISTRPREWLRPRRARIDRRRTSARGSDLVGALALLANGSVPSERVIVVTDGILTAGETDIAGLSKGASDLVSSGVDRIDAVVDGDAIGDMGMRAMTTLERGLPPASSSAPSCRSETIADKLSRTTLPALSLAVPGATWVWPSKLEGVQAGDEVIVVRRPATRRCRCGSSRARHDPITAIEIPAERPLLERAWARANIERLQARRSASRRAGPGPRRETDRRIVALSREFRVLSDLTALLVLESEADYGRFAIDRRALADILVVGERGVTLLHRTSPRVVLSRRSP